MIREIRLPFDVDLHAATMLKAGELTCMYELGKLRYICRGETELIRMIYGAVRNEHWGTLPYTIENEVIKVYDESFSIQFTAVYHAASAMYKAHFNIEGGAGSSISFSMTGEALATFQKNRIGICVHHPIKACGGKPVTITNSAGNGYQSVFPEMVSPHQPLLNIEQMQWTTSDGTNVRLVFEGDVFETEDQRNWSDSSYKTYSTPLHIPFPVSIQAGHSMQQSVKIISFNTGGVDTTPAINETEEKIPFPKIGYSKAPKQTMLTAAEAAWLQKIPFHHYRVLLMMDAQYWVEELNVALEETIQLDTKLELVLVFPDQFHPALHTLSGLLAEKPQLVYSILPLQKDQPVSPAGLLAQVYPLIKKVLPDVLVGYGTDLSFVELNRQRPADINFDFVSYSLHPQAHMVDNRSLLENLDNQPDLVATAHSFAYGKPVFVSPVTLKNRYDNMGPDARQHTAMAAWWNLTSIQQLAMAGSITYCHLLGEGGLLQTGRNKVNNEETDSIQPSPLYEMLAAVHLFEPMFVIKRWAGNNLLMDGLLLENANGERLFFKAPEEIIRFKNQ